jgi:hypothetical protein
METLFTGKNPAPFSIYAEFYRLAYIGSNPWIRDLFRKVAAYEAARKLHST